MTITIEIKPELEAELAAQAAAKGMDVSSYAASLLEQSLSAKPQAHEQTLSEFLINSPLAGSGINLERDKDMGRHVSFLEFLRDSPLVGLELDFERDKKTS